MRLVIGVCILSSLIVLAGCGGELQSQPGAGAGLPGAGAPGGAFAQWGKFSGNSKNTGYANLPSCSGTLKWKYHVGGLPTSAVIGPDGTVYFGIQELGSGLYAVNGTTGALKWSIPNFANFKGSMAIGNDGLLYVYIQTALLAINTSNGNIEWQQNQVGATTDGIGLGSDGTVYIGTAEPAIRAYNGTTGALLWKVSVGTAGNSVVSCPAVENDGTVYAAISDGSIIAIRNQKGLWKRQTNFPLSQGSISVGNNGFIYVRAGLNSFLCMDSSDGTRAWTASTNSNDKGQLIGPDGTVYVSGLNPPEVIAYNPLNGNAIRHGALSGNIGLHAMNGSTLYAEVNDSVVSLNASTLSINWAYQTGDFIGGPVAVGSDGSVVFPSADGYVYALK